MIDPELIARLEEQERQLVLKDFDLQRAWLLGRTLADRALAAGLPVLIEIRRPNILLFRAALPGAAPDQEAWVVRKPATALRMEASSALVAARMSVSGVDPAAIGWLGRDYAIAGGSFPIRVEEVGVVAAVTASGLSSEADHELVVQGPEGLLG